MNSSRRNTEIIERGLDARWFLALKKIKRPLLLKSLTLDGRALEQAKKCFFVDERQNPVFVYPLLNQAHIEQSLHEISELRRQVCQKELVSSILTVYDKKLAEISRELELLLASVRGDWSGFMALNQLIYGACDTAIVSAIVNTINNKYGYFTEVSGRVVLKSLPSAEAIKAARYYFPGFENIIDEQLQYTSNQIAKLWSEKLSATLPHWQVVVDSTARQVLVSHRANTIFLPDHLRLSGVKLRKLFTHEIGTHVYRRVGGTSKKLQLLSIGLPAYQRAEEGIALVQEQLLQARITNFGGHDKYLAVAIASGAVDGVTKDFKDTYAILKEYFIKRHSKRHGAAHAAVLAQNRAWALTVRIFRGGNPELPGCCFMKDKIYREGNIYIWKLLEEHPEYFTNTFAGKFDPGNAEHRKLVQEFS